MRVVKILVIVLIGLSMSGCNSIVNKFAFHPDNINVIPSNRLPSGIQEITITTEDDVRITSLFLPSNNSDRLVIYFHGNAGNIYHRIPSLLQLQQFGVNVIGLSYRGYGKSEGTPTEEGIYLDGQAILQFAEKKMGFKEENITLFGRSIGTTVAVNTVMNKELRGVILVTPLTNGKEQAKAGGLGSLSSLAGNSFDNISKVEELESPLLVIHGTNDHVIPYAMSREIFQRAKVEKLFVSIKGADHNNLHDVFGQEYWQSILRFMQDT